MAQESVLTPLRPVLCSGEGSRIEKARAGSGKGVCPTACRCRGEGKDRTFRLPSVHSEFDEGGEAWPCGRSSGMRRPHQWHCHLPREEFN
eukprot:227301-Prymnesium_polylepis.1